MTYQRNTAKSDVEEDVADEPAQDSIGGVKVGADDRHGDDDDDGRREELALPGPLDLLQLGCRLGHEGSEATAPLAACARLAFRLADGLDLAPARAGALGRSGGLLELAAPAARGPSLRHYRVSRCRVCWPHQRQYFFVSNRSGVFRFDLFVW